MTLTRQEPLVPRGSALLVVDMQNYTATPEGGEFEDMSEEQMREFDFFFAQLNTAIRNISELQIACRANHIEVMYCVIESLTSDGRDRGLDYKITGFNVPRGSLDSKVIDALTPVGDEMVFSKTSSSVFVSTNIDYVLRSMGITQLVVAGIATDQCVESAIRDACDLGYLITMVTDACCTYSHARQQASEAALSGYCRQLLTVDLVSEISRLGPSQ